MKPLPDKQRHHVHTTLRMVGIDVSKYVLDRIFDTYEASRTLKNKFSIMELAKIEHANKQKHSILLSLVPDWYWDVD